MSNKRIFYASQSIHLQPVSTGSNGNYRDTGSYQSYNGGSWIVPKGLQSAGITTTFNTNPVQQLGTLRVYSQTETSPQVEVTLNKVLDGTAPLYCLCTAGIDDSPSTNLYGANKSLTEISNNMVNVRLAVFSDTNSYGSGNTTAYTLCSGMYLSRVNYTFPVDGNATEEVTLVGSSKTWGSIVTVPGDNSNEPPQGTGTATYVVRRQYVALTGLAGGTMPTRSSDGKIDINSLGILANASLLPTGFGGIPLTDNTNDKLKVPIIQNITISADLGRENINELGYFGPFYKYTTFPIEVTSEFEVIPTSGDLVNANDFARDTGCDKNYSNLEDKDIVIRVCGTTVDDYLLIDLGNKNKLTSVNYTGGDTGGGNATVTYSFQTFNKLNIIPTGSYASFVYFTDNDVNYTSSSLI